jgi:general stress protein YciG
VHAEKLFWVMFSRVRFQTSWGVTTVAKAKMTRAEAGRKGGQTTKKKYGSDFYSKIGSVGGKKGGQTTKKRYGTEFYQKIGRKGGMK